MKVLFINRHDRPDREQFQREQLDRLKIPYERIEAEIPTTAGGFQNRAFRGVFQSHLKLWQRIADEKQEYVIFEDDNQILDYDRMEWAIRLIHENPRYKNWSFLHFHHEAAQQETEYLQEVRSVAQHAYMINVEKAPILSLEARIAYERIIIQPKKGGWETAIDQWCKLNLYATYTSYGCRTACKQSGSPSNMGWRENLIEA
jgi:hypothetical protein